ncbi:hypothetical protein [Microscilla marina]|uniref:Uncharacterized protein n=1 Tax=Microscilla marina ATCC 23134 TaxID=313606 RepID=A1ZVK2_MICM2|nr:hypothetical protein [Microscilla marina]EAY25545.1 hypothetical protein M23134_00643 [Microscilla marina ATCC 23134]
MLTNNNHTILKDQSFDAHYRVLTIRMQKAVSPQELKPTLRKIVEEELRGNYEMEKYETYTKTMYRVAAVRKP